MNHATVPTAFAAILIAMGGVAATARADHFEVGPSSSLEFTAKITGSSFVAKTATVSGKVEVDMATGEIKKGEIVVKPNSFKTGMELRDKHMAEKYLKAEKFPTIRFVITGGKVATQEGGRGTIEGKLVAVGREKAVRLPVQVSSAKSRGATVTSAFTVDIGDFGIEQPKFMVVKMEKIIQLKVKLTLERDG